MLFPTPLDPEKGCMARLAYLPACRRVGPWSGKTQNAPTPFLISRTCTYLYDVLAHIRFQTRSGVLDVADRGGVKLGLG